MCLEMVSKIICSSAFPETEVRMAGLQFPRSSFMPFLQSSEMSTDHHNLSILPIDSCLTITLASFFNTTGCILSGPMTLCMSSLFTCSLTRSSCPRFLLQTFPVVSGISASWRQWRPRQRKHWIYYPFPCPLSLGLVPHSATGLLYSALSFAIVDTLLVSFTVHTRVSFRQALAFLTPSQHTLTVSLYFF